MFFRLIILVFVMLLSLGSTVPGHRHKENKKEDFRVLNTTLLKKYVTYFNSIDTEAIKNYVPNAQAFTWLAANIPLFECPDSVIQEMYYYRWWTFRKHLVKTPEGFIFTEFITPVSFAGKYNTESDALGHHIYEGRWLHNQTYLNQYIWYWLVHDQYEKKTVLYKYSNWLEDAIYNRYLVNLDTAFITPLMPLLDKDYKEWQKEKQVADGMFWQYDVRDAMEESISGGRHVKNIRPTINSYMYGNAKALAKMAAIVHIDSLQQEYSREAERLKYLVQKNLWDTTDHFFEVLEAKTGKLCGTREELGYIPWYFDLPDDSPQYAQAWDQLTNSNGFASPYGITTAERRSPYFDEHGTGNCEWDGPVWPFATTQTLKGLANLLTSYHYHNDVTKDVYFKLLKQYAMSQSKNGEPFIGEYLDGKTGRWLKQYKPRSKNGGWIKKSSPRSEFYNHSGFCDLVISGLVGLIPRPDDTLEVEPLIPADKWNWFCLDKVEYHHHILTILWDKTGKKYHEGKGFRIFSDGKLVLQSDHLKRVEGKI